MATQIKLPSLGEGVESGDVLSIFVGEGDTIQLDQDLLEIETDKATAAVPAPEGGKITKILVSEGDTIEEGTPLFEIEPSEHGGKEDESAQEDDAQAPAEEEDQERDEQYDDEEDDADDDEEAFDDQPATPPAKEPSRQQRTTPKKSAPKSRSKTVSTRGETPGDGRSAVAASPSVRRLARQLGVDLRRVRATGEGNRVTDDDVTAYVRLANQRVAASAARESDLPGEPDADDWGPVRRERMTRLRQTIARNMTVSYTTIPQLTNFDDADITELEELRGESKEDYAARGIKLTTMPFLIKAVASSLKKHPVVNASIDTETNEIVYKEYINLGIAVDTSRGLIVPVIRDVDRLNISQIASELARIAEMARDGDYSIDDLRGGTFTISNLGAIGGTYSTPIINPPEVAILLAGRSRTLPMYVDQRVEPRLVMPLSITYDHRIVDGAAAARFLNDVKGYLNAPGRLLLAP